MFHGWTSARPVKNRKEKTGRQGGKKKVGGEKTKGSRRGWGDVLWCLLLWEKETPEGDLSKKGKEEVVGEKKWVGLKKDGVVIRKEKKKDKKERNRGTFPLHRLGNTTGEGQKHGRKKPNRGRRGRNSNG